MRAHPWWWNIATSTSGSIFRLIPFEEVNHFTLGLDHRRDTLLFVGQGGGMSSNSLYLLVERKSPVGRFKRIVSHHLLVVGLTDPLSMAYTPVMRWFKTPEEYLEHYTGSIEVEIPFDRCPHCDNSGATFEIFMPTPRQWRKMLKKGPELFSGSKPQMTWFCHKCEWAGVVPPAQKRTEVISQHDYCMWVIENTIRSIKALFDIGIMPDGSDLPQYKNGNAIDLMAFAEMFSGNETTARTGMLLSGMRTYDRFEHNSMVDAAKQAKWNEFREEAFYAGRLVEEYFSRLEQAAAAQEASRRAQEAAERARKEDDERMVRLARQMAKEMFDEAERRRAEEYAKLTHLPLPTERRA